MKMKKASVAILATLALSTSAVHVMPTASAAEIDETITNLTYTGNAAPGNYLRADIAWQVPDYAEPGDTFRVELPEELSSITSSFDLKDNDGIVIARADASEGGVVFTLAEGARGKVNRGGNAFFAVKVSEDATSGTTVQTKYGKELQATVDLEIGDKPEAPEVFPRTEPYKGGNFKIEEVDGKEVGVIDWYITSVNKEMAARYGVDFDNATTTFHDVAQYGQRIDCDATWMAKTNIDVEGGTGRWLGEEIIDKDDSFECSPDEVTATVDGLADDQVATLYVRTIVDGYDPDLGTTPAGFPVAANTAYVTIGGNEEETDVTSKVGLVDAGGNAWGEVLPPKEPEPCDCEPTTVTVETTVPTTVTVETTVPTTETETTTVSTTETLTTTATTTETVETPVPTTVTREVPTTITSTRDVPTTVTSTTEVPTTITSTTEVPTTITSTRDVPTTVTSTTEVPTTVTEPTTVEVPKKGSSEDVVGKCVSNAIGSPLFWLIPVALLGQIGGELAAPYLADAQAQLNQVNAQLQERFANASSRGEHNNPFGEFGHSTPRRENEFASQFNSDEIAAQVNAANARIHQALNSPEIKQFGQLIGAVAAVGATVGLLYDWCTNENGEALTSFGTKNR